MNPLELKQNEIPRMEIVNRNFIIYRWVEIVLSIIGLVCIYFFKGNLANVFWFGFGIALFAQAIIMLCADYFAEQRALIYTKGLQNFVKGK